MQAGWAAAGVLLGGRTPTAKDWTRMSGDIRALIDERIATLTRTRDLLDRCIGCGCLSLERCALYNPGDRAGKRGAGPRYVVGDSVETADQENPGPPKKA